MTTNKLIAHILLKKEGKYLLIKRTKIKRGIPNVFPEYWDIPGGRVEVGELPKEAAIREAFEEVGQDVVITGIIHEDSNFDKEKNIIFTRLVYKGEIISEKNIVLDPEEHTNYMFVHKINCNDQIVDYVKKILKNTKS
ncbi:NUDIX hydrolase [Carnobacterium maltaromaticum]|uniref:NUDIX hydrolase n=1 Tax=Carnobacterium maltaromaticum TaxID=2751 RepID=UPI00295EC695|nr:NUDIX hydrolase [Carnobacterium maltaromaticum]